MVTNVTLILLVSWMFLHVQFPCGLVYEHFTTYKTFRQARFTGKKWKT